MNAAIPSHIAPRPGVLWGKHRFHELSRWLLTAVPSNECHRILMQGRLPGDERDIFRRPRHPNDSWLGGFREYVRVNRLVIRARNFTAQHPDRKPTEHFLHWWQCGIEMLGVQFFQIEKSVPHGNFWNASNQWELPPKELQSLQAHAAFLETAEQRYLLCLMFALYNPPRAAALRQQLGVMLEATQHLNTETRQLIFNLLATFDSF